MDNDQPQHDLSQEDHGGSFVSQASQNQYEIEQGIIAFFGQLGISGGNMCSLGELADGVALMELLSNILGDYFHVDEMERETEGNWALAHRNITKLMAAIEKYYQEILKLRDFNQQAVLDKMEISRNANKQEIIKLVELVLGIMVQSEQKGQFIQVITQLDKKHQAVLMHLMEKWIVNERLNSQESEDIPGGDNMSSSRISLSVINNGTQAYYLQQYQIVLRKLDELEKENEILQDRETEAKNEAAEKDRKLSAVELELQRKDDELKKLRLARDGLLLSLGMGVNEDLEQIVKSKEAQIEKLTKVVQAVQQQSEAEKTKLQNELDQLERKCKQLQKSNESMDFYKSKYAESNQLAEKLAEADKKQKTIEKALVEKDAQVDMLKDKLAEFKQTYAEERKRTVEQEITLVQVQGQVEQLRLEKQKLEQNNHISEDKIADLSMTIEKLQQTKQSQNQLSLSQKQPANAKGLHEDLSQIIDDLERENTLLKCEQNTSNLLDCSALYLEDAASLRDQLGVLRKSLEQHIKEKAALEAKLEGFKKYDVEKLKADNDKLKADYQSLLTRGLRAKEKEKENERESLIAEADQKLRIQLKAKQEQDRIIIQLEDKIQKQEEKMNKMQTQAIGYKNLFEAKNEELEVLFGVLCNLKNEYSQGMKREKDSGYLS